MINFTEVNGDLICDECGNSLYQHIMENYGFRTKKRTYDIESIDIVCPLKFCIQCGEKKNIYTDFVAYKSIPLVHHTCKDCQSRRRKMGTKIRKYLKDRPAERRFYDMIL